MPPSPAQCLVRYGVIPEVARCRAANDVEVRRGQTVVVETHRGLQCGAVVQVLRNGEPLPAHLRTDESSAETEAGFLIVRSASPADQARQDDLVRDAQQQFPLWTDRIRQWNLDLQLIDLEWTFDRAKLILYVLNERGPECTKLAIQAAAAGHGVVEVQPVSSDGLVTQPESSGGCGSCGCHN